MLARLGIVFVIAALATGCGGSSSEEGDAAEPAETDPKTVTCADYANLPPEEQTSLVTDILEITDADKDKKQDPAAVLPMADALCLQVPDATVYEVLAAPTATTVPVTTTPATSATP